MSKSRGNAIALRATADETARLIRRARTDAERRITLRARAPAGGLQPRAARGAVPRARRPRRSRRRSGDGGASALKALVTEAVNERLAPVRARRAELMRDRGALRAVLREGNERARAIAADTLAAVRRLMHTDY